MAINTIYLLELIAEVQAQYIYYRKKTQSKKCHVRLYTDDHNQCNTSKKKKH